MSETTQTSFDLLLKGGHVIDPKNQHRSADGCWDCGWEDRPCGGEHSGRGGRTGC